MTRSLIAAAACVPIRSIAISKILRIDVLSATIAASASIDATLPALAVVLTFALAFAMLLSASPLTMMAPIEISFSVELGHVLLLLFFKFSIDITDPRTAARSCRLR